MVKSAMPSQNDVSRSIGSTILPQSVNEGDQVHSDPDPNKVFTKDE